MLKDYKNALKHEMDVTKRLLSILEHDSIEELYRKQPAVVISLIISRNIDALMQYIDLKDRFTMSELRRLAKTAGIPYYTQYNKQELLALLKEKGSWNTRN